jgi:hypothetical protein
MEVWRMTDVTPTPSGADILSRAICLTVNFSAMGLTRKVSTAAVDTVADKRMLRVAKVLLEADELGAIRTLDSRIREYLYSRSLPAPMFKSGVYLLPIDLLTDVDDCLSTYAKDRAVLVDAFLDKYPTLIDRARQLLGPLFDPNQYPESETVRTLFDLRWSYVAFETPGRLKTLNRALYDREAAKMAQSLQDAAEDIRAALRTAMADLVADMMEKMSDREGGKPKIFRDSSVAKAQDFLATFAARNLTDDVDLARLVDQAKALVAGQDPETLRASSDLRATIRAGFEQIQTAITPMLTAKPRRSVSFTDQ